MTEADEAGEITKERTTMNSRMNKLKARIRTMDLSSETKDDARKESAGLSVEKMQGMEWRQSREQLEQNIYWVQTWTLELKHNI